MPSPLYPWYPCDRMLGGSQSWSECSGKQHIPYPCQESNHYYPASRSVTIYWVTLSLPESWWLTQLQNNHPAPTQKTKNMYVFLFKILIWKDNCFFYLGFFPNWNTNTIISHSFGQKTEVTRTYPSFGQVADICTLWTRLTWRSWCECSFRTSIWMIGVW
jgi:hypothetical protein